VYYYILHNDVYNLRDGLVYGEVVGDDVVEQRHGDVTNTCRLIETELNGVH